jgi:hypothetical protein
MAFPVLLSNFVDGQDIIPAAAINNLEAKVGIDNSAVPASLDYLLKNPDSIDPGHKHSKLWASDGSPEAVTVDAAGNVGIGTTEPGAKLHIYNAGNNVLRVEANDGTNDRSAKLSLQGSGNGGAITGGAIIDFTDSDGTPATPGALTFQKGSSTYMTILNGGNVGIGTASPGKKLDVNGYLRGLGIFNTLNSAPADGDLAPGECALWFDKTDGAGKVMFKGKSANGTVVTGSLSLS